MTTVLVVNSGSSSIKHQLVDVTSGAAIASGLVERIGEAESRIVHTSGGVTTTRDATIADHHQGLRRVIELYDELGPGLAETDIAAVGHRVVMGGDRFDGPALIDDDVIATIRELAPLAPLHNPANLAGILVGRELLAGLQHVAVFDTAFFHGLPTAAATYALDRAVAARWSIRRYGAHGTSHHYVSTTVAEVLGRDVSTLKQIVLHLGNGASASAIAGGKAVDTSMGLTPLEGLVMGTRTGDIDAAVVFHLARNAGLSVDEIDHLFNHRSGMRGLTGENDLREVHRLIAEGDAAARLGLDVYCHRIRKYIGAYAAVLGGLDALTFTAGVGEHDPVVRARTVAGLEFLGVEIDRTLNEAPADGARVISPRDVPVKVLVVPTNEELAIARQAASLLGA